MGIAVNFSRWSYILKLLYSFKEKEIIHNYTLFKSYSQLLLFGHKPPCVCPSATPQQTWQGILALSRPLAALLNPGAEGGDSHRASLPSFLTGRLPCALHSSGGTIHSQPLCLRKFITISQRMAVDWPEGGARKAGTPFRDWLSYLEPAASLGQGKRPVQAWGPESSGLHPRLSPLILLVNNSGSQAHPQHPLGW